MPKAIVTHTPEQIARAREVHMRGGTQSEVASVLGCSQQTAGRRMVEWGWPRVRRKMRAPSKIRYVAAEPDARNAVPAGGAWADAGWPGAGDGEARPLSAQARRDLEEGLPDKHLPAHAADGGDLTRRLKILLAREMTRAELCGGPPAEVARTLASLARTMKLVSGLPSIAAREDETLDAARMERDITRRLEELLAEEEERAFRASGHGDHI